MNTMKRCKLCWACRLLFCRLERFLRYLRFRTMGTSTSRPTVNMASRRNTIDTSSGVTDEDLYEQLINSYIHRDDDYDEFLPDCELTRLLSERKIRETLEGLEMLKSEDMPKIVSYIREEAPRTFANLVVIGHTRWIYDLWKSGFTDESMPVVSDALFQILSQGSETGVRDLKPRVETFKTSQWIFMPIVFDVKQFNYGEIDHRRRIPFMEKVEIDSGGFSIVWRTVVHRDHLIFNNDHLVLDNNYFVLQNRSMQPLPAKDIIVGDHKELHPLLALKELRPLSRTEREEIGITDSHSEANVLQAMNEIDHPHLINTIAHYTQNRKDYFLFPFATRGSLRKFLEETKLPVLGAGDVRWVIGQMLGLAEAIRELHLKNCRHGDLKPDNILCFDTGGTVRSPRFVIADVGLAKIHAEITAKRRNTPTTTKAGTVMYSPPEYEYPNEGSPWSRLFDIWSLGCVFFELVVWMLEGPEGLASFRKSIAPEDSQQRTFYIASQSQSVKRLSIREEVTKHVTKLLNDERCVDPKTALRRVLRLIEGHMIVVGLPEDGAAEAEDMAAVLPPISEEDEEDAPDLPAARGGVSTSQNVPHLMIQQPTAFEAEDSEKRRIKAGDLVNKLQQIVRDIDNGLSPALALHRDQGKAASPPPQRLALTRSSLGLPQPGRGTNHARKV